MEVAVESIALSERILTWKSGALNSNPSPVLDLLHDFT
jgi:hypothetical protein